MKVAFASTFLWPGHDVNADAKNVKIIFIA
jgi:hypothetical protein